MNTGSLPRRRSGALRRVGWLSAAGMLAVSALAPSAVFAADPIQPIVYTSVDYASLDGNHTCSDFEVQFGGGQDWNDSKLDKSPEAGDTVVTSAGTITITAADGDTFSWSSTFGIDAVFVKSGDGGDKGINVLYVYAPTAASPEATVGTNLTDQGGETGISHVSFCWDSGTPPSTPPSVPPSTPPSVPPSTPPSVPPSTPPSVPPSTPPSVPPSTPPSVPPSTPPSVPPSEAPTGSELPITSEQPSQTGGVEGATGTPGVTPPSTDTIGEGSAATSGSWRIVLAGLASLIGLALVFTQPTRARRDR